MESSSFIYKGHTLHYISNRLYTERKLLTESQNAFLQSEI